jgi:hypothetical protein
MERAADWLIFTGVPKPAKLPNGSLDSTFPKPRTQKFGSAIVCLLLPVGFPAPRYGAAAGAESSEG